MNENVGMTHAEATALLLDYSANELVPEQQKSVEFHISQCEMCQQTIIQIRHMRALLSTLADPVVEQDKNLTEIYTYSLADAVLERLSESSKGEQESNQDSALIEDSSIFDIHTFSRPLFHLHGVVDAESQVSPPVGNNGTYNAVQRDELKKDAQRKRYDRMDMNAKSDVSDLPMKKTWKQQLGMLAAVACLTLIVGGLVLVLALAAQGRGSTGSPKSGGGPVPVVVCTPTPTPTPPPMQASGSSLEPTATPIPTPPSSCVVPTSTPVGGATPTPIPTQIPIATPTPAPTGIPTPTPTPAPTGVPAATPTPIPTQVPIATPTPAPTSRATPTPAP